MDGAERAGDGSGALGAVTSGTSPCLEVLDGLTTATVYACLEKAQEGPAKGSSA